MSAHFGISKQFPECNKVKADNAKRDTVADIVTTKMSEKYKQEVFLSKLIRVVTPTAKIQMLAVAFLDCF